MNPVITLSRARELLTYDPTTGELRWLVKKGSVNAGDRAGAVSTGKWRSYISIRVDGRFYLGHRLDKRYNCFYARATVKGREHYLGMFHTEEDAHAVYVAFAKLAFGPFARFGTVERRDA